MYPVNITGGRVHVSVQGKVTWLTSVALFGIGMHSKVPDYSIGAYFISGMVNLVVVWSMYLKR